jgi:DNA-binding Xre family transcriptional regulator
MPSNRQKKNKKISQDNHPTQSTRLEILRVQNLIKQFMRGRGYRYEDLATEFDVSLSTAKRMILSDDLSFERLLQLCKWLEIEASDLLTMAKIPSVAYDFYSLEQEQYLAHHPKHFAFLKILLRGLSLEEITTKYHLTLKEARSLLKDLEEAGFIERLSQDRIRFLVKPRNDWRVDGPLWQTYMKQSAEKYVDQFFKPRGAGHEDRRHMEFGHRRLTPESFRSFKKEVDDLYKKYVITSELEVQIFRPQKLVDMGCLLLVDQCVLPMLPTLADK